MDFPRIVIAALRGGSGKTILSIGIIAAWKSFGKKIAPFKKGPDYIDAGWLALAAGRPCYNLDTFLIDPQQVLASFISRTSGHDIAVVEGNRGLYDGIDLQGSTSTAELAKQLQAPVILCIDGTKTTRTMSAVTLGCLQFDPDVKIKGVILNRVAGSRHESILRRSIEHYCGLPVFGAVPRLKDRNFPERHMGLVPTPEHRWATDSIAAAAKMALSYIDLDALAAVAAEAARPSAQEVKTEAWHIGGEPKRPAIADGAEKPRIGIIRDSAFQFYYPENIEALCDAGADPVFISPLSDALLPPLDGLYIGGGFPETHAARLAENTDFRNEIKNRAEAGLPIYAECGGLMYLGEELLLGEQTYPMVGLLPIGFGFSQKPQGHGYTVVRVTQENPYYPVGTELKGHEFHYSKVLAWKKNACRLVFSMKRGAGAVDGKDGICYKNVLATYTHIHALGTPGWAAALVRNALKYREENVP